MEHHKARRVRTRHHNIRPSVAIQITGGHPVNRSLAVAKWHGLIRVPGELISASQNASLNASWMTRGFTAVLLMTPNVGEVKVLSGLANCGWFSALYSSARS
jgi:hypothetical protein